MHDFKDISILIHVQIDVQDRIDNLTGVMDYYYNNCENVQFVIVNDDAEPDNRLKDLYAKYGDTSKFLFQKNADMYHRTKAFNQASTNTDRDFLIAGDTDVIVHPTHLLSCVEMMRDDENIGAMYPYNGLFIHVSDKHKQTILETHNIDFLDQYIPDKEHQIPNYENEDILVAHHQSQGGCNMFRHKHWKTFNGYNPGFIGWGSEDNEINHRVQVMGFLFERYMNPTAIAWHLPHHNTVRDKEPYCSRNDRLCNAISAIRTKTEMEKYISTWKL